MINRFAIQLSYYCCGLAGENEHSAMRAIHRFFVSAVKDAVLLIVTVYLDFKFAFKITSNCH